jgi:hypothetical protein
MTSSNPASIIYVHSGESAPPEYLVDSIGITSLVALGCKIYVLTNLQYVSDLFALLQKFPGIIADRIELVAIETIPQSHITNHFSKNTKLDRGFRSGFWYGASHRFFVLADFMRARQLENCIHLENDVLLYFDPAEKLEQFRSFARFSVPLDRVRAIPGIVWFKDAQIASQLTEFMSLRAEKNDMDSLGEFCLKEDLGARPLPTMPISYAKAKGLSVEKYCSGIEEFGGLFDGAAIGQYVGGVHWMNYPGDTRFFVNESSDLDLRECPFSWASNARYRYPFLSYQGEQVNVLCLHAHSKDVLGVSPFNSGVPQRSEEMLTGERIQSLTDLTISSQAVKQLHGRNKIETSAFLEIPEREIRSLFKKKRVEAAPDLPFLSICRKAKIIFVYPHLLAYFKTYIAPRLVDPFILVSHNSYEGIAAEHLDLLNNPNLVAWFAQNCEFAHNKLLGLPTGLTNSQADESRLTVLYQAAKSYKKTKSLYVVLSDFAHSGENVVDDVIASLKGVSIASKVSYTEDENNMAAHQFCLCPRGNGVDTHRFWEAQYLDCIPVILKQDWTQAYSNLPVLVLNAWEDLKTIDLSEVYIRISSTHFNRASLNLDYYRQKFESILGSF